MNKRTQFWATALLVAVTFIWGFTFVVNQTILETLSPPDLQTWRFGMAAIIMVAIRPQALFQLPDEHKVHGALLGTALGGGYLLQLAGLKLTTATASGFITGLFVVLTPLIAGLVLKEPISKAAWFAVGLTTVGLGLIALNGWYIGWGELLTLACAGMFALHIIGLDLWSKPDYVYGMTTMQIVIVFLFSLIASLSTGGPELPNDSKTWWSITFLAVFATCIGFFAQTWVQSHIAATRTAIILTMEPVFAMIAGVTIGTDTLTFRMLIGASLILASMYIVELGPRKSAEGRLPHLEP